METKICSKCKKELTLDKFGTDLSKKDELTSNCKECGKISRDIYRKKKRLGTLEIKKVSHEGMKICIICDKELALNMFGKDVSRSDGLNPLCKKCTNEQSHAYREIKKLEKGIIVKIPKEGMRFCTHCDRELPLDMFGKDKRILDGLNIYCKECARELGKKFRIDNPEKRRMASKLSYINNKEQKREYGKKYNEENSEKKKVACKRWLQKNPEKNRQYSQRRRSKKLKLPNTLTLKQWEDTKLYFNNKCCYCGEEASLQQEHFIPLNKDGEYTEKNIIPSCGSCNSSKNDNNFEDWYPKYKFYSKYREDYIIDFINHKNEEHNSNII